MINKRHAFRGIRKGANLSRRLMSKGVGFSSRVENKANRIILDRNNSSLAPSKTEPYEKIYFEALPEVTPIYPSLPTPGREPSSTLLIPSLQKSSFFGGAATALIVAALVAKKKKLTLRVVETLKHGHSNPKDIKEFLKSADIGWDDTTKVELENLSGRRFNHYGYLNIAPDDIFTASAWWDAHLVSQLPLKRKFIYLIQDFEPIFYNNSDRYLLAESTYSLENFVALCNTRLMYDFMINRGYEKINTGSWFEPAVSRKTRGVKLKPKTRKRLFLYGRPSVERNLFYSALAAINKCFADGLLDQSEWEVVMAGQEGLPNIAISAAKSIQNLGKMDMAEYIELLYTTDIAVSPMMAPHPNYPTLEFAAAGASVVTTAYDIKQDLSRYSANIVITESSVEAIAAGIKKASKMKITKDGNTPNIESSWEKALNEPINKVLSRLK